MGQFHGFSRKNSIIALHIKCYFKYFHNASCEIFKQYKFHVVVTFDIVDVVTIDKVFRMLCYANAVTLDIVLPGQE